ncbi:MAG: hypothetical protein ACK5YR_13730 [Pirellula sp.]|jgi:hypothetical protein
MTYYEKLEQLTVDFARDIEIARNVESSNPEDDLAIKAAIVGFSYNSPTSDWAKGHYDFVNNRLEASYSREQLDDYGENGENVRLFFALAIGFLLGMYHQERISNDQFTEGEQQIPGLIMLHLPRLTEQPA